MFSFNVSDLGALVQGHPELINEQSIVFSARMHFSQGGEDIVVGTYLNFVRPRPQKGVFVDFGAYHPFRFSNTFLLYLHGWRGLNVDGNKDVIDLFKKTRPLDASVHCLVADKEGEMEFYKFPEGAFNTTRKESADILTERGKTDPNSSSMIVERVPAHTANQLLGQFVGNRQFDFLNIDIEGLDEAVFRSIDFDIFRPRIIAIETNLHDHVQGPLKDFTDRIGYKLWAHCANTAILVQKSEHPD